MHDEAYRFIKVGDGAHWIRLYVPESLASDLSRDDLEDIHEELVEEFSVMGIYDLFEYLDADIRIDSCEGEYRFDYETNEYSGSELMSDQPRRGCPLPVEELASDFVIKLIKDLVEKVIEDYHMQSSDDESAPCGPTVVASSALDEERALETPDRQKLGHEVDTWLRELDPLPEDGRHPRP